MIEGNEDAGDVEAVDSVSGAGNQGPMFDQDGVHDIYRAWHRVLAEYPATARSSPRRGWSRCPG